IRLPGGQEERLPLDADLVAIGRDVGTQYRVPDHLTFVAGRHVEIRHAGDQFFLADLVGEKMTRVDGRVLETGKPVLLHNGAIKLLDLSQKGTLVNGLPVNQALVKEGDVIQIGHVALHYHDGALGVYESRGLRVDVVAMSEDVRVRRKTLRILDNVNMSVLP